MTRHTEFFSSDPVQRIHIMNTDHGVHDLETSKPLVTRFTTWLGGSRIVPIHVEKYVEGVEHCAYYTKTDAHSVEQWIDCNIIQDPSSKIQYMPRVLRDIGYRQAVECMLQRQDGSLQKPSWVRDMLRDAIRRNATVCVNRFIQHGILVPSAHRGYRRLSHAACHRYLQAASRSQ